MRDIEELKRVAELIRRRNALDTEIARITRRPTLPGHLGEWVASRIFDIQLEGSAVAKAIDGRFVSGPLAGRTVNIKWYGKREGLLDVVTDPRLDYYLVLTGPRAPAEPSRGGTRPLVITATYLFGARGLLEMLRARGVKVGVATSVISQAWSDAEIFPRQANRELAISPDQRAALAAFGDAPVAE